MRTSKNNERIAKQFSSTAGSAWRRTLNLLLIVGGLALVPMSTGAAGATDAISPTGTAPSGEQLALRLTTDLTADLTDGASPAGTSIGHRTSVLHPFAALTVRPASLILPANGANVLPAGTLPTMPRWLAALLLSLCGFALGVIVVWRLNRHVIRQIRLSSAMEVKGRRRDYEFVLEKIEDKLQLREAQVKALNAQARDYAAREQTWDEEAQASRQGQKQISTLRAELADYVRELNASRTMQSRLQCEVRDLQGQLKPADAQLERHKKLIRQLSADLDEADMTVFNLREQVAYLQSHSEPATQSSPTAEQAPVCAVSRIAHLVDFGRAEAASLARGTVPETLGIADPGVSDSQLIAESHEDEGADPVREPDQPIDPGAHL